LSKFLNDFLLTMPQTQRQKLMELMELKQKRGLLRSDQEFKKELERLIIDLDKRNGQPTFNPTYQNERTNSKAYNDNLESIAFDLQTIFDASNTIDRLLSDNQQLSKSLLADVRKKIHGLNVKVERFKLLIENADDFSDGVYEQFKAPEYIETNEDHLHVLRNDRYGQPRDESYNAENIGNALQLAGIQSTDQLKTNYGRNLAKIDVRNRTGLEASNNKHKVGLAIDGSMDTFWAEAIIVDDVIVQNIDEIWSHDYHDYPKDGAICELEITLNGMSKVSELHFDPYAPYPLHVVSIHGYETIDNGGKMYELISDNHSSPYQRSQKSVERMIFQFPSVEISKLRILIRQENYVKENYLVSYDQLHNMEMWEKLAADDFLIRDAKDPGESMAEFDKKNELTGWNFYLKKLKEWAITFKEKGLLEAAEKAMELVKMGEYKNPLLLALRSMTSNGKNKVFDERSPEMTKDWLAINKLSYVYGAYNISVYGRTYKSSSISVTEPLPLSSNATRIALHTDEKHHDIQVGPDEIDAKTNAPVSNTARITDIEYYVAHKKTPLPSDWKPILPANKKYVEGELLMGSDVREDLPELTGIDAVVFTLRFKTVSNQAITIRRNGIPLPEAQYIIVDTGKKVAIRREFYSPSSIYTADYKPMDDAYIVAIDGEDGVAPTQYINDNGETGEFFELADQNSSVTLKHQPYIYRNEIFQYDRLRETYNEDSSNYQSDDEYYPIIVRVRGEEYKNITNYSTKSYDSERLKENGGKTFAHLGNRIIFGQRDDGVSLEDITVDYYYVTTNIRLKAILRRNYSGYESITPALYEYKIKCQSYDQEV
jgi:hypothetical protein